SVVYRTNATGHWYRTRAEPGATPVDLSAALDAKSAGTDQFANIAYSGSFLVFATTRFGCNAGSCVLITRGDVSAPEVVQSKGSPLVTSARPAISAAG